MVILYTFAKSIVKLILYVNREPRNPVPAQGTMPKKKKGRFPLQKSGLLTYQS